GEQLPEGVAAGHCDAHARPREHGVRADDGADADEAELLADVREDHVGVRLGEVEDLLHSLTEPDAEDVAGAHPDQRLDDLEAGALRVVPWVQESEEAGAPVRLEPDRGDPERTRNADAAG